MSKFKIGDIVRVTTQAGGFDTIETYWEDDHRNKDGELVGKITWVYRPEDSYCVTIGGLQQNVSEYQIELYKETKVKVPYTISDFNIAVFVDGQMFNIPVSDKTYYRVRELIEAGDHTEENIKAAVDKLGVIESLSEGRVTVKNNAVYLDGEMVRNSLAEKLLMLVEDGLDAKPWMRFMSKLAENPSFKSREALYNFLDHFQTPITEDGNFIAFKRVRSNFKDIHTGTMDNSPGTVVSMPREQVDDDSQRTCSSGLHACASIYLEGFGSWDRDKVVAVEINPRDVVAVPYDYQYSKMRVCQYTVLREVTKPQIEKIESEAYYDDSEWEDYQDDYDWDTPLDYDY